MRLISRLLLPVIRQPQLGLICAMNVFVMSGVGLVAPILSLYASTFSASVTLSGMIITLFGVGRLIVNLPAGFLFQRHGKRILLMAGPVILVFGAVGAALAGTLTTLILFRFIQGLGSGIYMTIAQSTIAEISTPQNRGRTMALHQGAILVGTAIGPAVGGFIAGQLGLAAPFWAYAAVCVVATLLATQITEPVRLSEPSEGRATAPPAARDSGRGLFTDRVFVLICLVTFGVFFTRTAAQWQLIPLLATMRFDMQIGSIGLLLTVQALSNFAVLPVTGMLVDRFGARPVTIASAILIAVSLVVVAFCTSAIWLWAGMIALGLGGGLNAPAVAAYAADVAPADRYGPAMGLMRTWGDAGFVLGPILVGSLADFASMGTTGGLVANSLLVAGAGIALLLGGGRPAARTLHPQSTPFNGRPQTVGMQQAGG
ncbi:MFS transporter [Mangrovibrevibacter kandeliae]|uniref:MFS transporter n=1 Tax=Mangrovibrevibacter kandeliae TaxID=2968473 RepID=UPI002118BCF5|nr:MFS transporter [Aurantimonas sp. CSK15Z-1]MCQ8783599.1 MFS transporter [Aurantimonas sp. CSK15Z-1]